MKLISLIVVFLVSIAFADEHNHVVSIFPPIVNNLFFCDIFLPYTYLIFSMKTEMKWFSG